MRKCHICPGLAQQGRSRCAACAARRRPYDRAYRDRLPSEYSVWGNMVRRCGSPKATGFQYYGGRGIKVCERWRRSFKAFLADMGPRPSRRHSIDRINVDGHYEPGNCRWATRRIQDANRRRVPF